MRPRHAIYVCLSLPVVGHDAPPPEVSDLEHNRSPSPSWTAMEQHPLIDVLVPGDLNAAWGEVAGSRDYDSRKCLYFFFYHSFS